MKPHGFVEISWTQSTMRLDTHGPFNQEGIDASFDAIKQSYRPRQPNPWLRLDVLDIEAMG